MTEEIDTSYQRMIQDCIDMGCDFYTTSGRRLFRVKSLMNLEKQQKKKLDFVARKEGKSIGLFLFNTTEIVNVGTYCKYKYSLRYVYAPKCIEVGEYSFKNCTLLKEVSLPKCTKVEKDAFSYCTSLENLTLLECKYIGNSAFYYCTALKEINLSGCTEVGDAAFCGCTSLKEIFLPKCTKVGKFPFIYCESLENATLLECEYVGERSFAGCTSLKEINLPKCTEVYDDVFIRCESLTRIDLTSARYITKWMFLDCKNVTIVVQKPNNNLEEYCKMYGFKYELQGFEKTENIESNKQAEADKILSDLNNRHNKQESKNTVQSNDTILIAEAESEQEL